jgi:uncharacterized protein YkwD
MAQYDICPGNLPGRRVPDEKALMKRAILLLFLVAAFAAGAAPSPAAAGGVAHLVAPPGACPGEGLGTSIEEREVAMRCLVNFARRHAGLHGLADSAELDRSAADKSSDILRCNSFSHFACGRDFTYWMRRVGYLSARCWRAGENLAWGPGRSGSVRSAFSLLIHSPPHRENILGDYSEIGIGLHVGTLARARDAYVWTQHFGSHCGSRPHPQLARLSRARHAP